eukprot:TRINITY_DN196874_c0_g1_i1.p1 TRINITY_DN196874_c0_g1~~TRINITY_DN196874_c0_g1_i1.p1  ORF type:complete len:103 (-),score=12.27 TRINITY_DN196874_c0_g1_i1:19-327(-)
MLPTTSAGGRRAGCVCTRLPWPVMVSWVTGLNLWEPTRIAAEVASEHEAYARSLSTTPRHRVNDYKNKMMTLAITSSSQSSSSSSSSSFSGSSVSFPVCPSA